MGNLEKQYQVATFAGGCFWCMVKPFDEQPGINKCDFWLYRRHRENPTYQQVCSDTTGHFEAVQITYDPEIFPYEKLLELYWQQIDPTDPGGQFHDRGHRIKRLYFITMIHKKSLLNSQSKHYKQSGRFTKPIVTPILPAQPSIRQKTIISTTIRKIGAIMNPIM